MKKTLSIILTLILSVGLLAGCNSKTEKEEKNIKVLLNFIPNMAVRFIGMKVGKYGK